MPKAVFVLSQKMLTTSVSWPADMLSAANQIAKLLSPESEPFTLTTVSINSELSNTSRSNLSSNSLFEVRANHSIDEIQHADLIYLPSLWRNPNSTLKQSFDLYPWLQHHFENGAIITGVGTGCCLMAEAGLLDHKAATTHWYYFDQFKKSYPQVHLKRQHFITQAGNLYCAASINSLADLTIHFIQRFFNREVAQHVERHFSHEIRQSYENASYFDEHNLNHSDEDILQTQLWLKNNLGRSLSMAEAAQQSGMSLRNFNRRFKEATGKTPSAYLQEVRTDVARDLLQSSNLCIGDIADKVGYGDVSYFTQLFKKKFLVTPSEFRTTVRAKLFHES